VALAVLRNTLMKTCDLVIVTAVIVLSPAGAGRVVRPAPVPYKADCQFCHGIDGDGRGDPRSPSRAANLHETCLNREPLIDVIAGGRPGTEMPHFDKYAYEDTNCYGQGQGFR